MCLQDTEGGGVSPIPEWQTQTLAAEPPDTQRDLKDNPVTSGPMRHPRLEANISIWGEKRNSEVNVTQQRQTVTWDSALDKTTHMYGAQNTGLARLDWFLIWNCPVTIWKVPVEGNGKDGRNVKKKKNLCLTPPSPQKNTEKQRGQERGAGRIPEITGTHNEMTARTF